ncbi:MAG: cysteinyl-tRNA synthetase, cysteinyl-tRNA synthetase [candidate division Kazan bacterium GW2011_GWA1_50_15]|uniref:Cysteine--tRNA ligase n=2 Tax=Bacteria division Kazan-3B-28 TaxID=1798534 RepID=A0A0G2A3R3_UNCK3|nr:MAG: cysteinyl-tRNA synthetase, cysteinyl-tRNA synthetase [candidate division Kazan bacterium GW2011_GWA1_50_15]KKW25548.1 MAG: Cysteine-tRNA ligase [candidate division Kazan bacterium GW2011_GWC1_52_13]KKW26854.1 MAG: Cysteine-tRNA ligase [candidate division Kazan bacterium GW2011_GWB1_52_7]
MYTCGPTVYSYAHIGNLRAYIAADMLRRVLEYNGLKVKQVINITDVGHLTSNADTGEDKVEQEAKKEYKTAKQITKFYADQFIKDIKALNIKSPVKFAWASKYIKEQITLIRRLERKGYTYTTSDGVYFDTAKFKGYGRLGKISSGKARIAHSLGKKRETDFALWKFSAKGEKRQQEWLSPWGVATGPGKRPLARRGFPGWHIECSAISTTELGQPFDIHTGGIDHVLIHHNDEIAQSEAAYGKPLANFWIHNEFLLVDDKKMAKSVRNFYTLADVVKLGYDQMAFRYLAIAGQYRNKLHFSKAALEGAQNSLDKLRGVFNEKTKGGKVAQAYKKKFLSAINDDLNLPRALSVVWDLVRSDRTLADKQATLLDFDRVLGLGLMGVKPLKIPSEIAKLARRREIARRAGDWRLADKIRIQIAKAGFAVDDTNRGPKLRKK